jgi:hypothetical protein
MRFENRWWLKLDRDIRWDVEVVFVGEVSGLSLLFFGGEIWFFFLGSGLRFALAFLVFAVGYWLPVSRSR